MSGCRTANEHLCDGCRFSCSCMTCVGGNTCNCSCSPLVALGFAILAISALVAVLALRCARVGSGDTLSLLVSSTPPILTGEIVKLCECREQRRFLGARDFTKDCSLRAECVAAKGWPFAFATGGDGVHAGIWAFAYAVIAVFMTVLTLRFGPDPHLPHTHYVGCVIPGALWAGCILVSVLSCYTTDYIRRVYQEKRMLPGCRCPCRLRIMSEQSQHCLACGGCDCQPCRFAHLAECMLFCRSEDLLAVTTLRERFVYDPHKGHYVLLRTSRLSDIHVTAE